jgi:integrase
VLSDALEELIDEYAQFRISARGCANSSFMWGARLFCARFSDLDAWMVLPASEQRMPTSYQRSFVSWLLATGRLRPSADYLLAAKPNLGELARDLHPDLDRRYKSTAAKLGYSQAHIVEQWSALARTAALAGCRLEEVRRRHLDAARLAIEAAEARRGRTTSGKLIGTHRVLSAVEVVVFHCGLSDEPPRPLRGGKHFTRRNAEEWARVTPGIAKTMLAYLDQVELTVRPSTMKRNRLALRELGLFLTERHREVSCVADIRRSHIEAFKTWVSSQPPIRKANPKRAAATINGRLTALAVFFDHLVEWGSPDAPSTRLLFRGDLPRRDKRLPRFLDDPAAAKLMAAARADDDLFVRLVVEMLARTGMRKSELIRLTVDSVVQIGSAFWVRVPVGKMHTDRYVPIQPQLKDLLDRWLASRPGELRSDLLFTDHGRPMGVEAIDRALHKVAAAAGVGHVTPHQLRHTLATQAVNRGMSLEAIAALLGHKDLTMTMVYARIADRTVAEEYFSVTEKIEALYDQPKELPATAEGREMAKLRREMHQRMLGNGYCARPVEMDCHFETVCESCTFFVTTIEFRPTLQRQRDDAAAKGQVARRQLYDGLLERLDQEVS